MTDEEFDILATKVLAGEASPEERAQLDTLLSQDAQRQTEFAELRAAWETMRRLGPLVQALDAPATPLPQYRMAELQSSVRKHFSTKTRERPGSTSAFALIRQWLTTPKTLAVSLATIVLSCGLFLAGQFTGQTGSISGYLIAAPGQADVLRDGKSVAWATTITLQPSDQIEVKDGAAAKVLASTGSLDLKGPQRLVAKKLDALAKATGLTARLSNPTRTASLQAALFQPLSKVLTLPLLRLTRDTQGIVLYSPRDETMNLSPIVLWKAEPGKTYDLAITDEGPAPAPPWELRGIVSPDLAKAEPCRDRPLKRDSRYRLSLCERGGSPLSSYDHTFYTFKEANATRADAPAEKIAHAYQLLMSDTCPGDALADLLTLPRDFAESEPVLRLKLALLGQLGLQEDYEATAVKLNPSSNTHRR